MPVNPEAHLARRAGDETLTPAELVKISLFAELGRAPKFAEFPGALVLRHYVPGEVIVRQGEPGWTAFYILTTDDLVQLRETQLSKVGEQLAAVGAVASEKVRGVLEARQDSLVEKLKEYKSDRPAERARPVVTAHLNVELTSTSRRPSFLGRLFGAGSKTTSYERPEFIPNDGATDISLDTRTAPMHEGELFGEMSCLNRVPRSATVIADRDCYLLEMLGVIYEKLRKDPKFKEKSDRIYRERALGPQLRKFSLFARMTEQQFEKLRQRVDLVTFSAGQVIHNEGDPSDAVFVIRNGMVKIVKNLPNSLTPRTLTYLGRGDFFGEAGVILGKPRTATSIASGHPKGLGADSEVELVRIDREVLLEVCQASPELQALFQEQLEIYRRREAKQGQITRVDLNRPVLDNPQFEEMGLFQGQKLMLVDLDRCTRCGDCMQACINTHDDGVSRLYLDGPRFGKYLVPNACRSCLDPVCMIGCPVRSIVRGESGEMIIKDWCIGCGLCADNCPYGSIHMHRLESLHLGQADPQAKQAHPQAKQVETGKTESDERKVEDRAVVCDLCAGLNGMGPACVYHCPHDAALRFHALAEFPSR